MIEQHSAETQSAAPADRQARKTRIGKVVSDKMHKTIVVLSETRTPHPAYGKIVRTSKKFLAHDERGEAEIGDVVRIMETRPLSKQKRWRLVEVLEKVK
jgi:small subunit ribosomal protein S17